MSTETGAYSPGLLIYLNTLSVDYTFNYGLGNFGGVSGRNCGTIISYLFFRGTIKDYVVFTGIYQEDLLPSR